MNAFKKIGLVAAAVAMTVTSFPLCAFADGDQLATSEYELSFSGNGSTGSNLADLTADALLWYAKHGGNGYKTADIALVGDSAFSGSLAAGSITAADVEAALGDSRLIEVSIKGRYLLEAMEKCVIHAPEANDCFITPANARFIINPDKPGLADDERYHEYTAVLEKIFYKDKTDNFDQTISYKIIMDETTYQSQSRFTDNGDYIVTAEKGVTVAAAVEDYLAKGLSGKVTEAYANPLGDGRVRITSDADLTYDSSADSYTYKVTRGVKQEDGNCWIYVKEDSLKKKLQGIIGNTLYNGHFYADIDGTKDVVCSASRYGVLVPVGQESGTFSLRYKEIVGNTTNLLIMLSTILMIAIVVMAMTLSGKKRKY